MIRPAFVSVDKKATPPTMTLRFEDDPPRFVTVRIRGETKGRDPMFVAVCEMRDFTAVELELLSDVARPREEEPSHVTTTIMLRADDLQPLPHVLVYCPGCCAKLGFLDTPIVYELRRCSVCRHGIEVRYGNGVLSVRLTVG